MTTLTAEYSDESITAHFSVEGFMNDFGVPRSSFIDFEDDDIELTYLEIAGNVISVANLPNQVVNAVLELSADLEFE